MNFDIIRAYDIRGIWGQNLTEKEGYHIGACMAIHALSLNHSNSKPSILIAYDCRNSSETLKLILSKGIIDYGCYVIELGMTATPALYFAMHTNLPLLFPQPSIGIMITGSHNGPEHNGFKVMLGSNCLNGKEIKEILSYDLSKYHKVKDKTLKTQDSIELYNVDNQYIETILNKTDLAYNDTNNKDNQDIKILWDAGNGASSNLVKILVKQIPGQHILMNCEPDGNFPNRSPNTNASSLASTINSVLELNCQLGLAFDGDGDRVVMITQDGKLIRGDYLLLIMAYDFLSRNKNAKIILDVKASQLVINKITEWGGIPILSPTGHSLLKRKMREEKALLAGEVSGHIFCGENYYGFDDGIFAACYLLAIYIKNKEIINDILKIISDNFITDEIKIPCNDKQKIEIVNQIQNDLNKDGINYLSIDGIRYHDTHSSWVLRPSNTEDCIIVLAESNNKDNLYRLIRMLYKRLEKVAPELNYEQLLKFLK